MVEPHNSKFRVITTNFLGVRIFRKSTVIHVYLYLPNTKLVTVAERLSLTWSNEADCKDAKALINLRWAYMSFCKWAPSSEFVSSSIPSWQILTAHAQPFRGARDLTFCQKVPLDSLLVWASSEGSGETARMRRLAWTFAARICDKYQIRLTRSKCCCSPA